MHSVMIFIENLEFYFIPPVKANIEQKQ